MTIYHGLYICISSIILLNSCSSNRNDEDHAYYIIKDLSIDTNKLGDKPSPPLPPQMNYGDYNFLLLDTSSIFYFQLLDTSNGLISEEEIFFSTTLYKIDINRLDGFLNKSIVSSKRDNKILTIVIAYPTDTIKNRAIRIILDHLILKGIQNYNVRKITSDENKRLNSYQTVK